MASWHLELIARAFRTNCRMKCFDIHNCCCDIRKDRLWAIFRIMAHLRHGFSDILAHNYACIMM